MKTVKLTEQELYEKIDQIISEQGFFQKLKALPRYSADSMKNIWSGHKDIQIALKNKGFDVDVNGNLNSLKTFYALYKVLTGKDFVELNPSDYLQKKQKNP